MKDKYTKNVFEINLYHAKYTTNTFTYLCTLPVKTFLNSKIFNVFFLRIK